MRGIYKVQYNVNVHTAAAVSSGTPSSVDKGVAVRLSVVQASGREESEKGKGESTEIRRDARSVEIAWTAVPRAVTEGRKLTDE